MFNQTFNSNDFYTIGLLVILEAILSADNALILAIIVRHLPKDQQKKALFYGLAGAFVLRFGAIIVAVHIIAFWWLQAVGALYLIYLPIKHFLHAGKGGHDAKTKQTGFWMTVIYADLADLAFAIDSVVVAVAIEPHKEKVWVVYAGAFIGIILLRFAANAFIKVLERYPLFDHVAYLLVGWAGIKLVFLSIHTCELWYEDNYGGQLLPFMFPEMPTLAFWAGIILICGVGGWVAVRNEKKKGDTTYIREAVEEVDNE